MKSTKKKDIIYPKLSYSINGLLFEIHNSLGRLKKEKQYADAFEAKLTNEEIGFEREAPLPKSFRGEKSRRNIPDFIIEEKIVVDFKAKRRITRKDYYQMRRYLSSSKKRLGILANFRQRSLYPKRILNTEQRD